jgi:hypothetical protein
MRWLPRLLSHAAAAGRATARTTGSHARGSNGFASGRGGSDGAVVPREWLRKLWTEELRRQRDAARRWGRRAVATTDGGGADSFSDFARAPSRSYQHDDRDLTPVEVSGVYLSVYSLFHCYFALSFNIVRLLMLSLELLDTFFF